MQGNLVPWAFLALKDPQDPQVFMGRKVRSDRRVRQVLALKALKVNQALQVSQGTRGPRAPLVPAATPDCRGSTVRKVRWGHGARTEGQGPLDGPGPSEPRGGPGREDPMDETEVQDVRARKERKALKGPWGLQERPRLSPSKEIEGKKDRRASTAFLDHEEVKVCEALPASQGIRASTDPQASSDPQDPLRPTDHQDLRDHLDNQDHQDSSASQG